MRLSQTSPSPVIVEHLRQLDAILLYIMILADF